MQITTLRLLIWCPKEIKKERKKERKKGRRKRQRKIETKQTKKGSAYFWWIWQVNVGETAKIQ